MIAQQIESIIQMHNERVENAANEPERKACIKARSEAITKINFFVNEALQEMKEVMAESLVVEV